MWQAAGRLGIPLSAAAPAQEAGLADFDIQVRFRHPLARSAAYQSASAQGRQEAHGALAEVTDPAADPDWRAWHRAQAAAGPDDEVAAELERSAGRAQARGGLAAAAAFLQRSVLLTVDPARLGERTVAAAQASMQAGAFGRALELLTAAEAGPLDELQGAMADLLRGQIAFASGMGDDAPPLLLKAANRLEPLDLDLARETYLNAWGAAVFAARAAGSGNLRGDWGLGVEARCRALISYGQAAEDLYREAIERLGRTRLRPDLARAHLLYGEWLRSENRRADAREQLGTAHDLLSDIGMEAFAERARRELLAVGVAVRSKVAAAASTLTPQEGQIAQLAADGHSNPEIGQQLFLSARTVEFHLRKVYAKLGIGSRRELHTALAGLNLADPAQ